MLLPKDALDDIWYPFVHIWEVCWLDYSRRAFATYDMVSQIVLPQITRIIAFRSSTLKAIIALARVNLRLFVYLCTPIVARCIHICFYYTAI